MQKTTLKTQAGCSYSCRWRHWAGQAWAQVVVGPPHDTSQSTSLSLKSLLFKNGATMDSLGIKQALVCIMPLPFLLQRLHGQWRCVLNDKRAGSGAMVRAWLLTALSPGIPRNVFISSSVSRKKNLISHVPSTSWR